MKDEKLFIGYQVPTGVEVFISLFHMLVAGTTQKSGKTTLLKTLARQAIALGYKILIFDTKFNAVELEGFGQEIPICLRETADSLTILGLLESIMGRRLPAQYLATISRVAENAIDFRQVLDNAKVLEQKKKSHPIVQDMARNIVELLTRLLAQTADKVTSPNLDLKYPINRITMNKFALEGQQMIIKTAFEDALKYEKVIMILDEASKFLPQKYRSACDRAINHFVTQGAATKDFMWMGTQYLAMTNKDQMKAMDIKVLGRQSHDTECQHTLDLVPKTELKLTNDSIMGLKLGHFIVVADEKVRIVYTCPEFADKRECREVALGRRQPTDIHYRYDGLLTADEVKELTKRKASQEVIQIEAPPPEEAIPEKTVEKKAAVPPSTSTLEQVGKETGAASSPPTTRPLRKETPRKPSPTGKPLPGPLGQRIELLENNIEGVRQRVVTAENDGKALKQRVTALEGAKMANVTLEQPHIKVTVEPSWKRLKFRTDSIPGKIMLLAKEGFFSAGQGATHLRDVVAELERHHWTVSQPKSVKNALYDLVSNQILAARKENKEFLYSLCPYVEFTEGESQDVQAA